jgi:hypothetical protein
MSKSKKKKTWDTTQKKDEQIPPDDNCSGSL